MTADGKITHLQLDGKVSKEQLKELIEMAKKASKQVYETQKKALKESIKFEEGKK